jgi:hypothetical protein
MPGLVVEPAAPISTTSMLPAPTLRDVKLKLPAAQLDVDVAAS